MNGKQNAYFKILKDIFKNQSFSLNEVRKIVIGDHSKAMALEIERMILALLDKDFLVSVEEPNKVKYYIPEKYF